MDKALLSHHLETISHVLKSACVDLGPTGRAYEALLFVEYLRTFPLTVKVGPPRENVYVTCGPVGDHTNTNYARQDRDGTYLPPVDALQTVCQFAAWVETHRLNGGER